MENSPIIEVVARKATRGKKRAVAKRKKKVSVWDEFGIKRPVYVRYSGYAGVLWYLMSQYIRKSEFEQYGECVDGCGIPITKWEDCDLGHLKSASKLSTRFIRENLGLQRKWCNSPWGGDGNSVGFALTVDKRYGAGTALRLEKLSQQKQAPFSKELYREQISHYKSLVDSLI